MLNRRAFLQRIGAAAVAWTLAKQLPGIAGEVFAFPEPASQTLALAAGDVFTIAGVYCTNPITGRTIPGMLRQFVVTADVPADAVTISCSPWRDGVSPLDVQPLGLPAIPASL